MTSKQGVNYPYPTERGNNTKLDGQGKNLQHTKESAGQTVVKDVTAVNAPMPSHVPKYRNNGPDSPLSLK